MITYGMSFEREDYRIQNKRFRNWYVTDIIRVTIYH